MDDQEGWIKKRWSRGGPPFRRVGVIGVGQRRVGQIRVGEELSHVYLLKKKIASIWILEEDYLILHENKSQI